MLKLIAYFLMLAFDLTIIGGAAYLIDQRGWSNWTMFLALLIIGGSVPGSLFREKKS